MEELIEAFQNKQFNHPDRGLTKFCAIKGELRLRSPQNKSTMFVYGKRKNLKIYVYHIIQGEISTCEKKIENVSILFKSSSETLQMSKAFSVAPKSLPKKKTHNTKNIDSTKSLIAILLYFYFNVDLLQ